MFLRSTKTDDGTKDTAPRRIERLLRCTREIKMSRHPRQMHRSRTTVIECHAA